MSHGKLRLPWVKRVGRFFFFLYIFFLFFEALAQCLELSVCNIFKEFLKIAFMSRFNNHLV